MSAVAAPRPAGRAAGPLVRPLTARAGALVALAVLGALRWGDLVAPAQPGRLLGGVVLGAGVAIAVIGLRAAPRGVRAAALGAVALGVVAAALLLAGVPARFLRPAAWDDLVAGLSQGIGVLAGVGIPYDGGEAWVRIALLAGGVLLPPLAAAAAFRVRRDGAVASPLPALLVLGVLFGVPAVQLESGSPHLLGLVFAALLCAGLWLERIPREQARAAGAVLAVGLLAALVLAPRVDAGRPLIDYEGIAQGIGTGGGQGFTWDHRYGPLDWPREGREMLRVRAQESQYWKAVNLTEFDGRAWRIAAPAPEPARLQTTIDESRPEWRRRLAVTVRDLVSPWFIGAGSTLRIEASSARSPVPAGPGTFRTVDRPLRSGQTYAAEVYVPEPSGDELDRRPGDYPSFVDDALTMRLPPAVGGPVLPDRDTGEPDPARSTVLTFPDWNEQARGLGPRAVEPVTRDAQELLEESAYARTHALAQRLREEADTPHELARSIMEMFREDFVYSERPPPSDVPLDAFLFDDREGYCQQFSGAMALMLRMAGVPARVASGFSPGVRDDVRDEWVVRDLDAHSWVEAYLPGAGWVTYDPTPSASPARGRDLPLTFDTPDREPADLGEAIGSPAEPQETPAAGAAPAGDGGSGPKALVGGAVALLALAGLGVWALRRRAAQTQAGADAPAGDLERALRRAGRPATPGTTLAALRRSLPDGAGGYVDAVVAQRFGYAHAGPTPAQRAGLRRALAGGAGPLARLRGWWALPPRRRA
ncbi:MAG: transglutaminaseTgpA domain-containing protein [Solirubrobacteraceae bacterium]